MAQYTRASGKNVLRKAKDSLGMQMAHNTKVTSRMTCRMDSVARLSMTLRYTLANLPKVCLTDRASSGGQMALSSKDNGRIMR